MTTPSGASSFREAWKATVIPKRIVQQATTEIYILMKTEYAEVEDPGPPGTVGSSTMPQKRNPQLCQDILSITAEIRALVPLALETMPSEHEADQTATLMVDTIERASILTGEALERLALVVGGLQLHSVRMRTNLNLSGGLISSEAIMLELGKTIGRQHAHEVVYEAAQAAASQGKPFVDLLRADPRVTSHLSQRAIDSLLDPTSHVGLSAAIALEQAQHARQFAREVDAALQTDDR